MRRPRSSPGRHGSGDAAEWSRAVKWLATILPPPAPAWRVATWRAACRQPCRRSDGNPCSWGAGLRDRLQSPLAERNQRSGDPHRVLAHAGGMVTDESIRVGLVEVLEPCALRGASYPVIPVLEGVKGFIEPTCLGDDLASHERAVDRHEVGPGQGRDDGQAPAGGLRHPRFVRLTHGVPALAPRLGGEVTNGRVDDPHLAVLVQIARVALQLARLDEIIGVEELEIFAMRFANATISGGGEAVVALIDVSIATVPTHEGLDDRL